MLVENIELGNPVDLLSATYEERYDDTDELAARIVLTNVTFESGRVLDTEGLVGSIFYKTEEGDAYEMLLDCKINDDIVVTGTANLMTGVAKFTSNCTEVIKLTLNVNRVNRNRRAA